MAKDPERLRLYKKEYARRWYAANQEHIAEYRRKYREKLRARGNAWYFAHRDEINRAKRERRRTDEAYRLKANERSRISEMKRAGEVRARKLAWKYGLTPSAVEAIKAKQKDRCAICGQRGRLFIDHCHSTGKVRALLCATCNWGIGHFRDDIRLMEKAIEYLRSHLTAPISGTT